LSSLSTSIRTSTSWFMKYDQTPEFLWSVLMASYAFF
jgi:hypothetical protein